MDYGKGEIGICSCGTELVLEFGVDDWVRDDVKDSGSERRDL